AESRDEPQNEEHEDRGPMKFVDRPPVDEQQPECAVSDPTRYRYRSHASFILAFSWCLFLCPFFPCAGSRTPDPGLRIPDPGLRIPDPGSDRTFDSDVRIRV